MTLNGLKEKTIPLLMEWPSFGGWLDPFFPNALCPLVLMWGEDCLIHFPSAALSAVSVCPLSSPFAHSTLALTTLLPATEEHWVSKWTQAVSLLLPACLVANLWHPLLDIWVQWPLWPLWLFSTYLSRSRKLSVANLTFLSEHLTHSRYINRFLEVFFFSVLMHSSNFICSLLIAHL